jgi:hypothetical protein
MNHKSSVIPISGSELQLIQPFGTNEFVISSEYTFFFLVMERLYPHVDQVLLHDRTYASLC